MITNGAVDRVVHASIADECSRSTVKNSLAMLVRVMEQAVRDGIIDRNPAKVTGWQREYQRAEDELDNPGHCRCRIGTPVLSGRRRTRGTQPHHRRSRSPLETLHRDRPGAVDRRAMWMGPKCADDPPWV